MQLLIVLLNNDVLCAYSLTAALQDPHIVENIRNRVREASEKIRKARSAENRFPEPFQVRFQRCEAMDVPNSYGMTSAESLLQDILKRIEE